MRQYTAADGPGIQARGTPMNMTSPVYLLPQTEDFTIRTIAGDVRGGPGDFVAHDPICGAIWRVTADQCRQNYQAAPGGANQQNATTRAASP